MNTKGLIVSVLTDKLCGDCSNNGISSKNNKLLFVDASGPFEGDETNSVKLVRRNLFGSEYLHVEPLTKPEGRFNGPMFGGNFIYSSDSRFREISAYPIPIHDRYEQL